jgi:hypothetical protein
MNFQGDNWTEWLKARIPDYEIYVGSPMIMPILNKLIDLGGKTFLEWGFG